LGASFLPTTPLDLDVTLGPDTSGVDFGFDVNIEDVITALEGDEIPTAGENGVFWKLQLRVAIQLETMFDDPPVLKRWYGPVRMHGFLDTIQGLYLVDPYQFTYGDELQAAYDLLRIPYEYNSLEDLVHQLLIAELNYVSDQGIVGERAELMGSLIAWGEGVVADILAGDDLAKADRDLGDVIRVFRGLNTGGGGDIDD